MERNYNSYKTIVLMYLFLTTLASCIYPKSKFGKEANANREKIGLEILPETWKTINVGDSYTVWKNPIADNLLRKNKPLFFSKSISYNEKNNLISEDDLYYSGNKFSTIDGQQSEFLSIKYYFTPQKLGDNEVEGWYCSYISSSTEADVINNKEDENIYISAPFAITLKKADSLLREWGLETPHRISAVSAVVSVEEIK